MQLFRGTHFRVFVIAFWCALLINMNFYVIEVKALKSENKALLEQAKKLLASMTEEEQESSETSEGNPAVKEIDFLQCNHYHLQFEETGVLNILRSFGSHIRPHPGYSRLFSPPPDQA